MPEPIKADTIKADPIKRTIVVTGGSRGLGLAIARRLATAGYGVVAVARKMSDQLSGAMKEISGDGSLDFAAFDLGDTQGIPNLARTLRPHFRPVNPLVTNPPFVTATPPATFKH